MDKFSLTRSVISRMKTDGVFKTMPVLLRPYAELNGIANFSQFNVDQYQQNSYIIRKCQILTFSNLLMTSLCRQTPNVRCTVSNSSLKQAVEAFRALISKVTASDRKQCLETMQKCVEHFISSSIHFYQFYFQTCCGLKIFQKLKTGRASTWFNFLEFPRYI